MPHLPKASSWASATFSLTSGSRFSLRRRNRLRKSRPTAWLACLRLGEMNGEPEVVGFFVGCAENLLRLGRQTGHTLAPARSGPDQDQLANKAGRMAGDLLSDEATNGETQHVDPRKLQRSDEGDGVCGHFLDGSWHFT